MPFISLFPGESITPRMRWKISNLCNSFNTQNIILRTTTLGYSDFFAMVDITPTIRGRLSDLLMLLDEILTRSRDDKIYDYALQEGVEYNHHRVGISIAPFLHDGSWTLTEHPNRPEVQLIDKIELSNGRYLHRHGRPQDSQSIKISRLINSIRETGLLSDKRAYQYEGVYHPQTRTPLLTQIRDFADKKTADYDLGSNVSADRIFGVTPSDGIVLPIIRRAIREDCIIEGDNKNTPYIVSPEIISNPLRMLYAKFMQGYMPLSDGLPPNPSLTHQNTRLVQQALRREGFAMIDPEIQKGLRDIVPMIKDGAYLRIITDAKGFQLEIL